MDRTELPFSTEGKTFLTKVYSRETEVYVDTLNPVSLSGVTHGQSNKLIRPSIVMDYPFFPLLLFLIVYPFVDRFAEIVIRESLESEGVKRKVGEVFLS